MGLIPTLLNIYARNKRYQQQRELYDQNQRKQEQDRLQQQALSTLNSQPNNNPFGDIKLYDPETTYRQLYR